jgi:tetratricopeptide (TPR) repeat protein
MNAKAILVALGIVVVGLLGLLMFLTGGEGTTIYVADDAALLRERGEHLLNKRRHTSDPAKRAEYLTEAIDKFKKAIELKPDFEVAYNMLGHSYIERGQWEQALQHLNKALELRPDYPAALFNRAHVYKRLSVGKRDHELIDRAIADYKRALGSELAANFTGDIHKALADAYHQKGDLKTAIEHYKKYLKVAPHAPDATLIRRKIRGLQLMKDGQAPPLNAPLDSDE